MEGLYPSAPFLHPAGDVGLPVVAALKDNLHELRRAAQRRFQNTPPHTRFPPKDGSVEIWDADDFIAWQEPRWPRARALR